MLITMWTCVAMVHWQENKFLQGEAMRVITIDFETYYSREYSLSKMTTEAYIRDPRFEVIGVGIKVNDNPPDWYSGRMSVGS